MIGCAGMGGRRDNVGVPGVGSFFFFFFFPLLLVRVEEEEKGR